MKKFNIGDIVRRKGIGNPKMTVESITAGGFIPPTVGTRGNLINHEPDRYLVNCVWINDKEDYAEDFKIVPDQLELVSKNNESDQVEVGDYVILKSGGPLMYVRNIRLEPFSHGDYPFAECDINGRILKAYGVPTHVLEVIRTDSLEAKFEF